MFKSLQFYKWSWVVCQTKGVIEKERDDGIYLEERMIEIYEKTDNIQSLLVIEINDGISLQEGEGRGL